jgi:excisionase family DNA binding protein
VRKKRRTEITIETERLLVMSVQRESSLGWCDNCAGQVTMITPNEAAVRARISPRTIYQWVEAGKLHFTKTSEGSLFICLNSLP